MSLSTKKNLILPSLPSRVDSKETLEWMRTIAVALRDLHNTNQDLSDLLTFADNAAALAGGLVAGDFYYSGGDPNTICKVD